MTMTLDRYPADLQDYERTLKERAARDLAGLLDVADEDVHKARENADRLDVYRAREALKLAVEALAHWQATFTVEQMTAWRAGYDTANRYPPGSEA